MAINIATLVVSDILGGLLVLGVVGFFIWRAVRKADDPAQLAFKWVITAGILAYAVFVARPMLLTAPAVGLGNTLLCLLVLAVMWVRSIAGLVANPLSGMFDGGSTPPDPRPFYSIAQARQKQGRYLEAVAEVERQLARFPTDFEGHMLLAQIQAENLCDTDAAEQTIERLCAQRGHAPKNMAFALYSMADWHLRRREVEAARQSLERLMVLLPETEFALGAAQRIAHLDGRDGLNGPRVPEKFVVKEGIRNLGLLAAAPTARSREKDPGQQAADYATHLQAHPDDTEAREKLAGLYADHFGRLDLATTELEQLITQPAQPGRLVVHWLNLLADLQIRGGAGYETVRETLQRIIDRDPKSASAQVARNRLGLVRLELKAQQTGAGVKMGTYEQNIGLKGNR